MEEKAIMKMKDCHNLHCLFFVELPLSKLLREKWHYIGDDDGQKDEVEDEAPFIMFRLFEGCMFFSPQQIM